MFVKGVKRQARKKFAAEEKIRVILEGMKRGILVSELCRREGNPAGDNPWEAPSPPPHGNFPAAPVVRDGSLRVRGFQRRNRHLKMAHNTGRAW